MHGVSYLLYGIFLDLYEHGNIYLCHYEVEWPVCEIVIGRQHDSYGGPWIVWKV